MKPEVLETVIETADVAQETSQEVVEEAKEVVEKTVEAVEEKVEEVKEAAEEVKEAVINYGDKTLAELSGLFQELTESEDRTKGRRPARTRRSKNPMQKLWKK